MDSCSRFLALSAECALHYLITLTQYLEHHILICTYVMTSIYGGNMCEATVSMLYSQRRRYSTRTHTVPTTLHNRPYNSQEESGWDKDNMGKRHNTGKPCLSI